MLDKRGIPHEVLNAKQHTREAQIVTQAGRLGAVTVATNMAGRGVDIILGGNPEGSPARRCSRRASPPDMLVDEFALPRPVAEMPDEFKEARATALGPLRRAARRVQAAVPEPRATRSASSAACTCSAPSATTAGASTTSSAAASGRQGDPGESRFYLSLDDELMRLFATGAL